VPMLTCGLVRSNFFFAIAVAPSLLLSGWVDSGQTLDLATSSAATLAGTSA